MKDLRDTVDENSRIASVIAHPGAIDALISVSGRFKKLRNPVLRKVMAGQVTIAMAARIGGVSTDDILDSLESVGLSVRRSPRKIQESDFAGQQDNEAFLEQYAGIEPERIHYLDARPFMEKGQEPLSKILELVAQMEPGDGLCVLNSFAPEPLVPLLRKKGLEGTIVETEDGFEARFIRGKKTNRAISEDGINQSQSRPSAPVRGRSESARSVVLRINVVGLAPPEPMMKILSKLQEMRSSQCLYVYHEREPRFLFPHLAEQGYQYCISHKGPGDVRLLIGRRP